MIRALSLLFCLATGADACETALLLSIDVSGSIDAGEYGLQIRGLADALDDPGVAEVLVRGRSALAVAQWSGIGQQAVVVGWQRMTDPFAVRAFAARVRDVPRAFRASDTAVGEAITHAIAQFAAVADCGRRVIDISGDGPENAGNSAARARGDAMRAKIDINAIAIEDMGVSTPIGAYYRKWVITRSGFVMTARGLQDYARAIRAKLLRELTEPVG